NYTFNRDLSLCAIGAQYRVQIWSLIKRELVGDFPLNVKGIYGMRFSPDGDLLAVGAADKKIRIWKVS
ncbi:MAG: hypothetical protein ACW976_07600, partial [Candidatus Ranarchaeia archaeon]